MGTTNDEGKSGTIKGPEKVHQSLLYRMNQTLPP